MLRRLERYEALMRPSREFLIEAIGDAVAELEELAPNGKPPHHSVDAWKAAMYQERTLELATWRLQLATHYPDAFRDP